MCRLFCFTLNRIKTIFFHQDMLFFFDTPCRIQICQVKLIIEYKYATPFIGTLKATATLFEFTHQLVVLTESTACTLHTTLFVEILVTTFTLFYVWYKQPTTLPLRITIVTFLSIATTVCASDHSLKLKYSKPTD